MGDQSRRGPDLLEVTILHFGRSLVEWRMALHDASPRTSARRPAISSAASLASPFGDHDGLDAL